ncbi:MAG: hypothetical protein NE327_07570 [Lentisphaeraceae bacterium]|nr:hypothetical protein [Lentisphaeraceae bacterium]
MNADAIFVIRIPTSNLDISVPYFKSKGFKAIAAEEAINTVWIQKGSLIFSLCECAAEYPMLVFYMKEPDKFLNKIDALGIVCNFAADHLGNHFEAIFTDPGGFGISVADAKDLPEQISEADYSSLYELAIPSVPQFADSINFWNSLGFKPVPDIPRPHPWCRMQSGNLTIGIHQSQDWLNPSLVFENKSPIVNEVEISRDLKSCGTAYISETCDHLLIYRIS